MENVFTVDVEDYYQVAAFSHRIKPQSWNTFPSRVDRNTQKILDLLDEHGLKATFFVLGWVAEHSPALTRSIAARGHEIACHGYSHQLIYEQDVRTFRSESLRAKSYLEDQTQRPILGYRAASYSITRKSLWALDILAELGFKYDSSIFPIHHDRYGIPGSPRTPYEICCRNGLSITELPPTTLSVGKYCLPVGGGGYFRIYPYSLTRLALRYINRQERRAFMFYIHPWEIDSDQPRIRGGWLSDFRHYINLSRCESRLHTLLNDFNFGPAENLLKNLPLATRVTLN